MHTVLLLVPVAMEDLKVLMVVMDHKVKIVLHFQQLPSAAVGVKADKAG
jgi:hypothetical protein